MARSSFYRASAVLLACAGLLISSMGTAAAQGGQPPGLEPLWSEYPLNPDTTEAPLEKAPPAAQPSDAGPPLEKAPPTAQPSDAGPPVAPAGAPAEDGRRGSSPWDPGTFSLLAVLTALVIVILVVLRDRPAIVHGFAAHTRVRRRQGGSNMSGAFRWIRGRSDPRGQPDASSSWEDTQHLHPPANAYEFYSGERRPAVESERREPADVGEPSDVEEPSEQTESSDAEVQAERGPATAAEVGEHVTAVIASAQQAAEQMRREAVADAERLRAEAREEIKGRIAEATREAEKMRADAETYSDEARRDADAYAGEKQAAVEGYAARIRSEAEEHAKELREAAKHQAERIEKDARRRREVLTGEAERFGERLQSLHTVFQGITAQLEALLAEEPEPAENEGAPKGSLTEAIRPNTSTHVSA